MISFQLKMRESQRFCFEVVFRHISKIYGINERYTGSFF